MDCSPLAEDHCFTADTRVLLADGSKPRLDELIGQTGMIQTDQGPKQFTRARLVKKDQATIKLTFSDGSVVRCTPDHKFMTTNGDWVLAENITNNTPLKQINNNIHHIKTENEENADVYCLTVPELGRFAAWAVVLKTNSA